jgi:hypothetical protein
MAGGKIYLREKDGLVAMTEARYDAEDILGDQRGTGSSASGRA